MNASAMRARVSKNVTVERLASARVRASGSSLPYLTDNSSQLTGSSHAVSNRSRIATQWRTITTRLHTIATRTLATAPSSQYRTAQPLASYAPSTNLISTPGLFGINGLHKPEDFVTLAANKEKEVMLRIDLLSSNPVSDMTIQWIDDISKLLCDITDVAELCRNIHADPEWCESAHTAWMRGQELMAALSLNPAVTRALVQLTEDVEVWSRASGEARRVALDLMARMNKKEGDEVVDQFTVDVSQQALQKETDFAEQTDNFSFVPIGTSKIPKYFSQLKSSGYCREERGQAYILNHPSILEQALMQACDKPVRRALFAAYNTAYAHRGPLLTSLLHRRYALAALGGHLSHSHMVAGSLLSKDPVFTTSQLLRCAQGIEGSLRDEYALLQRMLDKPMACAELAPSSVLGRFFSGKEENSMGALHASDLKLLMNKALLSLTPEACRLLRPSCSRSSWHRAASFR